MKGKLLITFLALTFFTFSATAQVKITQFKEDPIEFMQQLGQFMTTSKMKEMEEVYKKFEKYHKEVAFSASQMERIIRTSNKMLDQKMTASSFFKPYLNGLTIVKNTELGDERFNKWHVVLNEMLDNIENRKKGPFKDFLLFSLDFFEKKTLRYSKSGISWIGDAFNYDMLYEEGPKIKYEKVDLIGARGKDTILIQETKGIFNPIDKMWKGEGGKVTWERFGLGEDYHAVLGEYGFEMTKSLYEVPNVKLYYPTLFNTKAIEGSFKDKVVTKNKATDGSYPRFESRDSILVIETIGDGIKYVGGFRLHGTTVYGYGSKENKATIAIANQEAKKSFFGKSELFVIKKGERIVSERVESSLYLGQDSIYHPSVNVRFEIPQRELRLNRGDRGSDRNPFYTSFHNSNIDSDYIDWMMNSDSILIGKKQANTSTLKKEVVIESLKFYQDRDYERFQNISTTNPLSTLKLFSDEEGSTFVDARRLAKRLNPRYDITTIQSLLYDLVSKGFINYDSDEQVVEIKDKVFHYAEASQKKVDYDEMRLVSKTEDLNAVLSLEDYSVETSGVKNVEFSSTQKVALKPVNDQVTMKQNRNLDFDGRVFAGFGVFEGKDYSFDYNGFNIKMDSVRYMDMFVPTGEEDKNKNPIALSIGSRIEHLQGVLLIDAPSNKSGAEDIEMFPSFQSKGNSYVYYDAKETKGGCYMRDSFYFQLNPFSFNSLDNFTEEDINYKGTMVSAYIFPDFKEVLVLQDDASLGFDTETPEKGYDTYVNKGNYKGKIHLSNVGFLGKGNIEYLGSNSNSDSIIFKPYRTISLAKDFNLEEARTVPEFPQVSGIDLKINWVPYQDTMIVINTEAPFEVFQDGLHTLDGTLGLTPKGLRGDGLFDWDKGSMTSKILEFGAHSVDSDTTNLQIKALSAGDIALDTRNVKASLDFDKGMGNVKANSDELTTTLPYNKYRTSMNEFIWDMQDEKITFKSEQGQMGSFESTHPDQDSLFFQGERASYDLKTNELKIGGVPFVIAADAFIYPENGDVEILPGGVMTTLNNARIVADTINQYHVINKATVDIKGKRVYRASGFYEYNIGDKEQELEFANIVGEPSGKGSFKEKKTITKATGEVKEGDNFFIDHKTEYRGKISLSAEDKNLSFEGFARLDAPLMPGKQWFSINTVADKNKLLIGYDTPKNYKGDPLETGFYLSGQSAQIYPRVMMPKWIRKDRAILEAKGLFKYDLTKDEFSFGDTLKIRADYKQGNKMVYNVKNNTIKGEGLLDIGSALDYVNITASGRIATKFKNEGETDEVLPEVTAEVMAGLNFNFPDKLLKLIVYDLQSSGYDAANVDYTKDSEFYVRALAELIDDSKVLNKTITKLKNGVFEMPKKYNDYQLLFSNLDLKWDPDYQSFISSKPKVGVGAIDGTMINKELTCFVEFKMPTNEDDRFYVYIKSPSEYYYFFGYKQGVLNVVSNNVRFNDAVLALKKKEAIIKMDDGELYEIQPVNPGTAEQFVNRIKALW